MLGQEPEYILSPDTPPSPRKAMALSWRLARLGVDLHVGILAHVVHHLRERELGDRS